jgi:hypothetical protein
LCSESHVPEVLIPEDFACKVFRISILRLALSVQYR